MKLCHGFVILGLISVVGKIETKAGVDVCEILMVAELVIIGTGRIAITRGLSLVQLVG